ncbi:MAG TPA: methylated-DNA--[protein]-cysteine S-methyltransferase [Steroidobacteraceae bacterium]|nr:methylated-DNA--[protein]-cysteine S-methyltransferase [Steroidobacteraceae bacterium]
MHALFWHETDSPVGRLLLAGDAQALTRVHFQAGPHPRTPPPEWRHEAAPFTEAIRQLAEYFAGARRAFSVPLTIAGSEFQRSVWQALRAIPYGETISYGELARRVGSVPRAVGLANGANPLPIIIPCHRVIGADGSLTGFGGGLAVKRALLELEDAGCVSDLFSRAS